MIPPRLGNVYHLPAYAAVGRWVAGRRVVVVEPDGAEGPLRLLASDARRVIVVGDLPSPPRELQVRPGVPDLPFGRDEIDVVVCLEPYAGYSPGIRRQLLREAHRVLRIGGLFAAWVPRQPEGSDSADFWTLETELSEVFRGTTMIAQMPWSGVSLAPVLDDDRIPTVTLEEALLEQAPEATHYLAFGFVDRLPFELVEQMRSECVLIPVPATQAVASEPEEPVEPEPIVAPLAAETEAAMASARARINELEAQLESRDDELQGLTSDIETLEESLAVVTDRAEASSREFDALVKTRAELQKRCEQLETQVREATRKRDADAKALELRVEEATESKTVTERMVAALQTELATLTAERDRRDERAAALQLQMSEARTAREHLQERVNALAAQVRDAIEQRNVLQAKVEASEEQVRESATLRAELSRRCDGLELDLREAVAARESQERLAERVEAELADARQRLMSGNEQLAERSAEASRLAGELQAVRERLADQEAALAHTRTRAEELSKTAARQDEQGRTLAEVAADRDRLRDELKRRSTTITGLEERLWAAREEVQKERLEVVRLSGEVARLSEQAERAHEAEQQGRAQVERLSAEVRAAEVARSEAEALLRSRDEEVARLKKDADALSLESADLDVLRKQLAERGRELSEATSQLEQARVRASEAAQRIKTRDEQLSQAGTQLEVARKTANEREAEAAALRSEIEVKSLEIEQLAASVANLHGQLDEQRQSRRHVDDTTSDLQRRLEQATEELDQLRNRLRQRDQELADVVSAKETHGVELYKLRQELEAASHVNEQLEEALRLDPTAANTPIAPQIGWPDDAVAEARRLRAQLAAQTRRHAEQLARIEREREPSPNTNELHAVVKRAELEADVRAEEQEQLLALLEGAEQQIWEMNDASDRNAARLAASLAQLEKHKELIDETLDELEVTRRQLASAQARALEQERLVASERAKLLRAGIDPDGVQAKDDTGHEDPFADLNPSELTIELHVTPEGEGEQGAPKAPVADRQGTSASATRSEGPRIVVEAVDEDDEEWVDAEVTKPAARRSTSVKPPKIEAGSPTAAPEEPTMPRLRIPTPPRVGGAKPGSGSGGS